MTSVLKIRDENGNFIPINAIRGDRGKSAYEQAKEGGYTGTEEEFTQLLNGLTGAMVDEHISNTNNPHKVTAEQVGGVSNTEFNDTVADFNERLDHLQNSYDTVNTQTGRLQEDIEKLDNRIAPISSYLIFAGNVNSDMLDAAFGKNNVEEISGVGKALVMYSKFKGETLVFQALPNCKNLSDIENSEEALAEIKNSSSITSLIEASPYANGYLNEVKKALNKLLPTEYQRDSVTEMITDTKVMGYMYDNYETFEASGILSSDEFISIATAQAISFYDGSDIAATTETNGLHKKVLLISMTLSVNTANVYPWTYIGNKTKAVGYRPDGTTYLVQRQSVSSTASSCDCTSFVKGKFASKVVQLPYGVSATCNTGFATQYNTVYYIPCE